MPIRGENIGTAYVRVIADGKDLDNSIRDMFADADADFNEMGQRGSQAYADGWEKHMASAPSREKLRGAIGSALASGDFSKEFLASPKWQEFQTSLVTRFGDAGRLAGERMERELFRSGVGGLNLDDLNVKIANAQAELFREMERMTSDHNEALRINNTRDAAILLEQQRERDIEFERNHAKHLATLKMQDEAAMKESLDRDREFLAEHTRLAGLAQDAENAYIKEGIDLDYQFAAAHRERAQEAADLHDTYALLNREATQLLSGDYRNAQSKSDLRGYINSIRADMKRLNIENKVWTESLNDTERSLILLNPGVDRFNRNVNKIADTFGVAFGRGSRNNFLNFMGSFARNMALFPRLLSAPIGALSRFGSEAGLAFRSVRDEGGSTFRALSAGMFRFVSSFGNLGVKIASSVVGAFGFAGPLLSMISLLGGVVTALVSSLSFGLVGALGALPALLLPAIAGVGTLALAFGNLSDAQQKALKIATKPLVQSFKGLADAAAVGVFSNVEQQAQRLAGVLDGLRPMFRSIGHAVSDVGDSWIESMTGDGFERWRDLMTIFLPDAVRGLGRITENVIGGFGGLFAGMIPFMRDVLAYFEKLTLGFSEWANSTEGQSSIVAFFERTKESLIDVGDFLGSVRDLFVELMDAGQSAGDGMFASMSDAIDGWVRAIRSDPKILQGWFDSAEEFGRAIGNVAVAIGNLFDTLDTEASRMVITSIFNTLSTAIELLVTLLAPVARLLDGANRATDGFVVQLAALALIGPKVIGALGGMITTFGGFSGGLSKSTGSVSRFGGALRGIAGVGGLGLVATGFSQSNKALGILLSTLGGAATGFALGGPIGALIGGAAGGLLGLVNAAGQASDAAKIMEDNWSGLAGTLDEATGATTELTKAYFRDELARQGILADLEAQGVSRRTTIAAMMGQKDAMAQVEAALSSEQTAMDRSSERIDRLVEKRADLARSASPDSPTYDPNAAEKVEEIDKIIEALEAENTARKDTIDTIRNGIGALEDERRLTRLRARDLQQLTSLTSTIPKNIVSKIKVDGIQPTTKGIARVASQYKLVDGKQIRSLIEATGVDTTVGKVRKVMRELGILDAKKTEPKITGDTKDVDAKVRQARNWLSNLAQSIFTPKVNVDNTGARNGISETERWLNSIQDELVYVNVERRGGGIQEFASGGIVYTDSHIRAGEAGPEAVVPLNRSLSQVDPAVRWLSAIAQGLAPATTGGGKTVNVGGLTVISPTEDPHAVATEVLNTLVASAYGG